jgi:DNA-binding NtrC family response regulator
MSNSSNPPVSGTDRTAHVLLVDDDVLILRTLKRLLRHSRPQWEVTTASNAADALAMLKERRIDVLVTDLTMPGMHGNELIELVRATYPNIPCVIHSTRSDSIPQTMTAQATAVLQKPVTMKVFVATIDGALSDRDADGNGTE